MPPSLLPIIEVAHWALISVSCRYLDMVGGELDR